MNETINGLLTVKPGNEPELGAIKTFTWQERTSKTGKPWVKIKSETEEYGGKPCRIVSAEQTDYKDNYGNLSFNLEIEPVKGAEVLPPMPSQIQSNGLDTRQLSIIRQHSQSMALELLTLKGQLGQLAVEDLSPAKIKQLSDFFFNDVIDTSKL
jgi:hypothetical protein